MIRKYITRAYLGTVFGTLGLCFFAAAIGASHPISHFIDSILGDLLVLIFFASPVVWIARRVLKAAECGDGRSDIRQVIKELRGRRRFPVEPYFDRDKGLFVGLDASGKPVNLLFRHWYPKIPIYIPWEQSRTSHKELCGATGSGKGVLAANIAVQHCILDDQAVVYFDPKPRGDEWAPRVVAQGCKRAGKKATFFDLYEKHAQLNPFRGATEDEVFDLLDAGCNFEPHGEDAVYKGKEKAAARVVAKWIAQTGGTFRTAVQSFAEQIEHSHHDRTEAAKAQRFWDWMQEMASLESIQADDSSAYDFETALSNGEFLYLMCGTDGGRVQTAQQLLLYRLMQIMVARDRDKARRVCVVLDELKYVLCRQVLTALSTIRDRNCNLILQHQSLADLKDCGDLDPRAVSGRVLENTTLKIVYRVEDPDTAEWFSRKSGKQNFNDASLRIRSGLMENPGTVRTAQRNAIEENTLLALPRNTGVLYGVEGRAATIIQVSPLQAGPRPSIYSPGGGDLQRLAQAVAEHNPPSPTEESAPSQPKRDANDDNASNDNSQKGFF